MPDWLVKLARRLLSLSHGRYIIVLTVSNQPDWTVQELERWRSERCCAAASL